MGVSQVGHPCVAGRISSSTLVQPGLCLAQDNFLAFPLDHPGVTLSCCVKFSRGTDKSHCDIWMKRHVNTFNPSAYCVCLCVCVCGRDWGGAEIKEACPVVLCGPQPTGGRQRHPSINLPPGGLG